MTKEVQNNNTNGRFSLITKDSAISLGVVIAMISVAIWTTSSHEVMKSKLITTEERFSQLTTKVEKLEKELSAHSAKGINGLAHPEGILSEIEKIKEKMSERTIDRWKKIDDYLLMKNFCELNKLQMPNHLTAEQLTTGVKPDAK